jgi:mRNA interferase HigB
MRIIGLNKLYDFSSKHTGCRKWISNWIFDVQKNLWQTSHDIRNRYNTASFLADNVVIFNVKGNEYRLEVQVAYKVRTVAVIWIGTHAEYTQRHG